MSKSIFRKIKAPMWDETLIISINEITNSMLRPQTNNFLMKLVEYH